MTEKKEKERADVSTLISRSMEAVRQKNALALRKVSADALTEAAMEGHREMILVALVDYALSKIMSKVHYRKVTGEFYDKIVGHFKAAREGPKKETIRHLERIEDMVMKLDEKEGHFAENVMEKAKVKKAAKLYEQGLSLKRAADLTGAEPVKVLDYVGGSKIHEFKGEGRNAKRLKAAREVFS